MTHKRFLCPKTIETITNVIAKIPDAFTREVLIW